MRPALMGFGVVFIATFGTVIFANVTAASPAQQVQQCAKTMGVSPGQSTKLRRTVAGLVEKRDGKTVRISLH